MICIRFDVLQQWMKDPNYDDFCSDSTLKMVAADFDADGRDDLLCQGNHWHISQRVLFTKTSFKRQI